MACGLVSMMSTGCDDESDPAPQVAVGAIAQTLDSVVCELAFDCECNGRQFETRSECTAWATTQEAQAQRLMETYDLEWDPTCVGSYVREFEELQCASQRLFPDESDVNGCDPGCDALHGRRTVGAGCVAIEETGYSTCDGGLRCRDGICVERCPAALGLDAPCRDGVCDEGLFCYESDEGLEPQCQTKSAEGGSCVGGRVCAEGLRCFVPDPADPTVATCELLGEANAPCMGHRECATGYCPAGFCADLPSEGDDCRGTDVCAGDLFCIDDVCAPAKERGASCTEDCGGGLSCVNGVCLGSDAAACWPDSPVGG